MTLQSTISWFSELGVDDRPTVGGKGASLGELVRAGTNVPPGFVITTAAFRAFIETNDSAGQIRSRIESLRNAEVEAITRACNEIRTEFFGALLPGELQSAVEAAYVELSRESDRRPVAVRSSATSEDNADASFAGLQDTFLWIRGIDDLVDAVKKCWSSLYSVESVTYRLRLNVPEDEVAMAVVVQDMVDARTAGVMFTRSPLTGDKSVVALEASWGLGSAVVSGDVTPDRFLVNKITGEITQRQISPKLVQHVPDMGANKVVEVETSPEQREAPSLSDEEISELVRIGRKIEAHYGTAMDIEWAVARAEAKSNGILLLQARPETVWNNRDKEKKAAAASSSNPMAHVLRALTNRGG